MKITTKKLEDGTTVVEGMTSAELLALAKKRADAGDGSVIKLAKRADEAAGLSNREAELERACDREIKRMRAESIAKRDAREPVGEYEAYRRSLHESAPAPRPAPAAPPRDEYFEKLWSDAQRVQQQMPELTVERIFAQIYCHPEEIAKRKARLVPNTIETDGDAAEIHDDEEISGQMDGDNVGPELGHRGEPVASTMCEGSSVGQYEHSGMPTATNSSMVVSNRPPKQYDPKARPASALKSKSLKRLRKMAKKAAKLKRRALAIAG
jgi:hypothetical protein